MRMLERESLIPGLGELLGIGRRDLRVGNWELEVTGENENIKQYGKSMFKFIKCKAYCKSLRLSVCLYIVNPFKYVCQ